MVKRKILWATTRLGPQEIKIYKSFRIKNFDGYTTQGKNGFYIDIAAELFDNPAQFDDTLLHEFIHVIDFTHAFTVEDYKWSRTKQCSNATRLIGTGLAQMLRELRCVEK